MNIVVTGRCVKHEHPAVPHRTCIHWRQIWKGAALPCATCWGGGDVLEWLDGSDGATVNLTTFHVLILPGQQPSFTKKWGMPQHPPVSGVWS